MRSRVGGYLETTLLAELCGRTQHKCGKNMYL